MLPPMIFYQRQILCIFRQKALDPHIRAASHANVCPPITYTITDMQSAYGQTF